MSDGARHSAGRRASDNLSADNEALRAEIIELKLMLALEQALRRGRDEDLARYHRRAGSVIDIEFE